MVGLEVNRRASRQRLAPPIDRATARRGESGGGYEYADPQTLAPGIESELARYPGTAFDGQIVRDRGPWFSRPRYTPPGNGWVNWTQAGPLRAELNMRNATWRNLAGNSRSRYPVINTPTTGMHTSTPSGVSRTVGRYQVTPQMTAARQFRLQPGQYFGQTYSQTTRLQGGPR